MRQAVILSLAAVLALAGSSAALAQQPPLKIGVFDPQRVSEETEEGKRVQLELTALRDRKQGELSAKEKELTELQNQITAQGLSLSPEKRSTMEKDMQRKALELQQAREAARNEMQFELAAAQNRFQDRLLAVVDQFGREEGFTLILDRSMAAYATPAIDVTTAVVDRFNDATKRAGSPAPAPPPPPKEGGR